MKSVIVGNLLVDKSHLFGDDKIDLITNERFLPKILVHLGYFRSNSEVKRNRPDLFIELNDLYFGEIKIGKKSLWLAVGE